jgi:hypothetical protein
MTARGNVTLWHVTERVLALEGVAGHGVGEALADAGDADPTGCVLRIGTTEPVDGSKRPYLGFTRIEAVVSRSRSHVVNDWPASDDASCCFT